MIENTPGSAILSGRRLPYEEYSSDSESSDYASENPQSESRGELQKIFVAVKQIVDLLYELSVTIRNATPLDKFSKAANEDVSHFHERDLRHTQEEFPQLKEGNFLVKRLANANTRRRQIFKYLEKHQGKLSHSIPPPDQILLQTPQSSNDEIPQGVHSYEDTSLIKTAASTKSRPSMTSTSVNTQTTIATFEEAEQSEAERLDADRLSETSSFEEPEQSEAERLDADRLSETSSAKSGNSAAESRIRIPAPPKGALDKQSFECPYCYDILSVSGLSSWE